MNDFICRLTIVKFDGDWPRYDGIKLYSYISAREHALHTKHMKQIKRSFDFSLALHQAGKRELRPHSIMWIFYLTEQPPNIAYR